MHSYYHLLRRNLKAQGLIATNSTGTGKGVEKHGHSKREATISSKWHGWCPLGDAVMEVTDCFGEHPSSAPRQEVVYEFNISTVGSI